MIRVKLTGHEYRYEAFQILSLFYDKSEMDFVGSEDDCDIESYLDLEDGIAACRIFSGDNILMDRQKIPDSRDTKEIKNSIKAALLETLKRHTGRDIPWGILVGIRPTKIVHDLRARGVEEDSILKKLITYYRLSREKAELTIEVAKVEERYLGKGKRDISLYIGIPFCPTRCVYCSFTSNPLAGNQGLVEDYLNALLKEISETLKVLFQNGFKIDTLYIGGGTPTSLSAEQLTRLFTALREWIDLEGLREFTVEAGRPDSIDRDKLLAIKAAGCRRISINPQTMNDATLKRIGRNHTSRDIIDTYNLAREIDFEVINMDLIIGLPGEGIDEARNTIDGIKNLAPDNVTLHTMAIKRASILNEKEYRDNTNLARDMYSIVTEGVREMGLKPYYMYRQKNMVAPLENVGFSTEGTECIYNIQMIAENISIISMGADAVTKLVFEGENRIERVANLKDVREYIKRIDEMIENKKRAIEELDKYYK